MSDSSSRGTVGAASDATDGASAASGPARPAPSPAAPPSPFPARGKAFLGVQTATGPFAFTPVDAFSSATGYRPPVLQFTQGWEHDTFNAANLNRIAEHGMLPIVA
jgi:hypothetical protein